MKILKFILLSIAIIPTNVQSQDLLFKFHNAKKDSNLELFIKLCKPTNDDDVKRLTETYYQNKDQIVAKIDSINYVNSIYRRQASIAKVNKAGKAEGEKLMNAMSNLAAEIKQINEAAAEKERLKKEQERQEAEQRMEQISQNARAHDLAEDNNRVIGNSQMINNGKSQSVPSEWLTSDSQWNKQLQISMMTNGYEATKQLVEQRKRSAAQPTKRITGSTSNGRIVSGATSNGQSIKLKISGNSIVAYGHGTDAFGNVNWVSVIPQASISSSRAGYKNDHSTLSQQYSYSTDVNGMRVYFDM